MRDNRLGLACRDPLEMRLDDRVHQGFLFAGVPPEDPALERLLTMEWGFRFLKESSFRLAEIFLEILSRIQALAMIMVPCLFIYTMIEFRLSRNSQEIGVAVTGQTKKQTQNPTLKSTFYRFGGVRELRFQMGETVTVLVINMTPEFWKTPQLLGTEYVKLYWRKRTCGIRDEVTEDLVLPQRPLESSRDGKDGNSQNTVFFRLDGEPVNVGVASGGIMRGSLHPCAAGPCLPKITIRVEPGE